MVDLRPGQLHAQNKPFVSHELDIFSGETYDPKYVRLRLIGCLTAGMALANDHTGTTSAAAAGCDACVVPTVALAASREVLVDSKRICIELDRRNPSAPGALVPEALRDRIEAELSIVDNLPNYQLLVAALGKSNPSTTSNSLALTKVNRCDSLIADNLQDEALCGAYAAKRAKELAAAERLFDPTALEHARNLLETSLRDLDSRLERESGPYLYGSSITMADLFWGVELVRIAGFGMAHAWSNGRLPAVDRYYRHLSQLDSVRDATA